MLHMRPFTDATAGGQSTVTSKSFGKVCFQKPHPFDSTRMFAKVRIDLNAQVLPPKSSREFRSLSIWQQNFCFHYVLSHLATPFI